METLEQFVRKHIESAQVLLKGDAYKILLRSGVRGDLMHNRTIMILRQILALTPTTFNENAKIILDTEMALPTFLFYERMDLAKWNAIRSDRFYKVTTNWGAEIVAITELPNFFDISVLDVIKGLGFIGNSTTLLNSDYNVSLQHLRKQRVIEWSINEYSKANAQTTTVGDGTLINREITRKKTEVFRSYIYNTLHMGLNPINLENSRWGTLKQNLREWKEFGKLFDQRNLDTILEQREAFFSNRDVYLWGGREDRTLQRAVNRGTLDTRLRPVANTIPQPGRNQDNYYVREILGIPQPYDVHIASFSVLAVYDSVTNNEITLVNIPRTGGRSRSATVSSRVTSIRIGYQASNSLAHVTIKSETSPFIEGSSRLITGDNIYTLIVMSQDLEQSQTHTITITKTR